jgi:hypothetical protein
MWSGLDTKTKQVGLGAGRSAFTVLRYFRARRWRLYIPAVTQQTTTGRQRAVLLHTISYENMLVVRPT